MLVPSSDPHLSEYLPERWQGRQWASGFTGSVGTLVVTLDRAALFADSRYWVQAERELAGSGIELVKIAVAGRAATTSTGCAGTSPRGATVAVDGDVLGLGAARQLRRPRSSAAASSCAATSTSSPAPGRSGRRRPTAAVYEHRAPEAPRVARRASSRRCARRCARPGATHHFVSTVDDIAWLLNLRGADVSYNPVFLAHLLIAADAATLFVAAGKVDAALAARARRRRRARSRPTSDAAARARRPAATAPRCCSIRSG